MDQLDARAWEVRERLGVKLRTNPSRKHGVEIGETTNKDRSAGCRGLFAHHQSVEKHGLEMAKAVRASDHLDQRAKIGQDVHRRLVADLRQENMQKSTNPVTRGAEDDLEEMAMEATDARAKELDQEMEGILRTNRLPPGASETRRNLPTGMPRRRLKQMDNDW